MSDNWWFWLIVLVVLILLALLLWWWFSRRGRPQAAPEPRFAPPPAPPAAPEAKLAPPPAPQAATPTSDDLTVLEGIGPKIAGLLKAAGITTFAQLAKTDVGELQGILREANLRIADPTTWPKQASLAAAGKWHELKAYTDQLKGGRQV